MSHSSRHRLLLCLLVFALAGGATAEPASAHDSCSGGVAERPYRSGGKVKVFVRYLCSSQHAAYVVDGCLQRYESGAWRNKFCMAYDTYWGTGGSNCNCYGAWINMEHNCQTGWWRGKFRYGEARNVNGQMAHWQTADEVGPQLYVSSC
jgi:hypothetical protein